MKACNLSNNKGHIRIIKTFRSLIADFLLTRDMRQLSVEVPGHSESGVGSL